MNRRHVLGAAIYASGQAAWANDLLGTLKGQLEAAQNAGRQSAPVVPQFPSRFDGGVVSPDAYFQVFSKNFNIRGSRAIQSPIRGLGLIRTPPGFEPVFLNSMATFFGARKWFSWPANQPSGTELPAAEQDRVRQDVLSRLSWDMLVGPVWGAGAPRKALVWSAPDCPFCQQMELELASGADKKLQYELYYLPTMLAKSSMVANQIWCSSNKPASWLQAMARKSIGSSASCDQDYYSVAVSDALSVGHSPAPGQIVKPTPTLILDSGERGNWAAMKSRVAPA
ncbi:MULTISPECIES: thioredoxin fold domain-containing protein [Ramlibacter]|uniref:Thioredoxin fold domain-containing protein n=1 Tax=Ramlibacter pinisoli TaxID=2682844 RepID=A0A6N8IM09_9BURK|nr:MULTISPECIES: thioredoxin fold domain-containing protein [Ramlibacter]MBA2960527.1 thioredoxin fold domain-containing protein [Ramlibacter sp. CGMCC 1.13660]MVQ27859.1 thioredoxin fold domain-containing protein [Ramlibacter pinisoli]